MSNTNRIVRIHNNKIHKLVNYVSRLTSATYQHTFNELCLYLEEGHVIGEYTHHKLIERILEKRVGSDDI